ncbi:CASP-like protein 4D1 [Manihot esculenta]|uniref:CASP-like protein n=1 Tax=Manihot esculenta TaxID=3983 RepID=A0A2C9U6E2_MANES|nr:CASP-like protein 4D1 [Manihot esculenta]OAY25382.1 hypothetical protein MANES_17G090200v8 [Manihot esculenta]
MSEPEGSKKALLPIAALILRVLTMILLLVSLIILVTDSATFKPVLSSDDVTIRLKYIYSYRYMLATEVLGLAYTFLRLPFSILYMITGKRLIDVVGLSYFNLFSDKVILSLLASGVGAGFGATYDLKKNLDDLDDILQRQGYTIIANIRSELDDFFNMGYVSATLLLLGFLFFGVSSFISSLALSNTAQN